MTEFSIIISVFIVSISIGILIGMKMGASKEVREAIRIESLAPVVKQRNRLADDLHEIRRFGKMYPGHGYSCAKKAEEALRREGF